MPSRFAMSVSRRAPVEVTLQGVIDERAELAADAVPAGGPVVLDLGGITAITSLGVKQWIEFVRSLAKRSPDIRVRRVPAILVGQASMIRTFFQRAEVESFYSPWSCPGCRGHHDQLHPWGEAVPAMLACPKCGAAMVFDDLLQAYETFLAR